MSVLKKLAKAVTGDRWEVRRCIWPYKDGYATYNPGKRMVLDQGLTREEAQVICDRLNANKEGVGAK